MKEHKHIINNYYYGKYDKFNFAIYERKLNSKNGNESFSIKGYYPSIKSLLNGIKRIYAKENLMNQDVETLISNLQLIEEEINNG